MKITYFIRDITDCGGIQQTTCHGINSIIKTSEEYDISVISLYHKNEECFFYLDQKVKKYALFTEIIDTKKQYFQIKNRLRVLLEQVKPDIIVVQGTAFANYISRSIWNRYRVIVCEHGHYHMGRKFGLHWFGKNKSLKYADAIVTLTELDALNYKSNNKKGIVIKKIYNPCVFQKNFQSIYKLNSKVIVSCGTLNKVKRFDHVIATAEKVFAKHSDWCWHIYGDGPEKSNLEKMIRERRLEKSVFIKGYETNKNVIYGDKSFMVLTSNFEGFGMVLVEAMQYHLPIISYSVNYGPKEIVEEGINGFLVESGNIELLSDAVEKMIEDTDKRQIMSKKAYQSLNRFDNEQITKQWIDLFEMFQ